MWMTPTAGQLRHSLPPSGANDSEVPQPLGHGEQAAHPARIRLLMPSHCGGRFRHDKSRPTSHRWPISPDSGFPPHLPHLPKKWTAPRQAASSAVSGSFPAASSHRYPLFLCRSAHRGTDASPSSSRSSAADHRPDDRATNRIPCPSHASSRVPASSCPCGPPLPTALLPVLLPVLTLVLIPLLRHHPAAPRPPGLQHHSAVHPPLRSPPVAGHPPPVANRLPRHDSPQSFRASAVGKYFLTQKQDMQALMHIGAARLPQARRFVQIGLPFLQVIDIQGFIF